MTVNLVITEKRGKVGRFVLCRQKKCSVICCGTISTTKICVSNHKPKGKSKGRCEQHVKRNEIRARKHLPAALSLVCPVGEYKGTNLKRDKNLMFLLFLLPFFKKKNSSFHSVLLKHSRYFRHSNRLVLVTLKLGYLQ